MIVKEIDQHQWMFDLMDDEDATDSLYEALDFMSNGQVLAAELVLTKLVDLYPEYIDVWTYLGLVYQRSGRLLEAYLSYREACRIGLEALAKTSFNWEKDVLDWGFIENRQFLRAYFTLAVKLKEKKNYVEAQEIFTRLIQVSPNDNLGARYALLQQLISQQDIIGIEKLFDLYSEDYSPEFLYGKVLLALFQQDHAKALHAFSIAKEAFPWVAKELKKKRHPKPSGLQEGYITMGGKDQAYVYWQEFGHLWLEGSQAHTFLVENH